MYRLFVTVILMTLLFGTSSAQTVSNTITGNWLSENKDGKIEIYMQGSKLFGKLTWIQKTGSKDEKNPNAKLRSRPVLGLVILTDFEKDSDTEWSGGKIYDPESGKTYSCKMKLKGNKLEIRGYVGISMFGRTSVWTRV